MTSILSCFPVEPSSLLPFSDPTTNDREKKDALNKLAEIINDDENSHYQLTSFEVSKYQLIFLLKSSDYDVNIAYTKWLNWIKWRRGKLSLIFCYDI